MPPLLRLLFASRANLSPFLAFSSFITPLLFLALSLGSAIQALLGYWLRELQTKSKLLLFIAKFNGLFQS